MAKGSNLLGSLQKLGKALMTPIAVLPAAGLLLRLGQPDVLNLPWMAAAGDAVFGNLALIFAVGIAVGLAIENNGVAGIAAMVGYFVLTKVSVTFDKGINMGVLGGILVGVTAAALYNKYRNIKLPDFLGFFGGRRFVPIVTAVVTLVYGVVAGYAWPVIQNVINDFGNAVAGAGALGAFVFGLGNRLLLPIGLHHVFNTLFWFQFGTFTDSTGKVVNGDLSRFFAGDPTAGTFMTGFFPIMMFALPAACLAIIVAAKKEKRKAITGMFVGIGFTSFLTGITEPIEFAFMFIAPALYAVHAVLTGASLAITSALGIKDGFSFSAGFIDYLINFRIASKPVLLLIIGLGFGVLYFVIFLFVIKRFNIPTPGRENDVDGEDVIDSEFGDSTFSEKAAGYLEALGGKENITNLDACVTRLRLTVVDGSKVNESKLKRLGASGVMKLGSNNYQVIVGTIADILASSIKDEMKK
ncbi:MAG: N-acetylglucosamine-specific PTS transporter subunit IIBC [Clostridiaceae bacterium]